MPNIGAYFIKSQDSYWYTQCLITRTSCNHSRIFMYRDMYVCIGCIAWHGTDVTMDLTDRVDLLSMAFVHSLIFCGIEGNATVCSDKEWLFVSRRCFPVPEDHTEDGNRAGFRKSKAQLRSKGRSVPNQFFQTSFSFFSRMYIKIIPPRKLYLYFSK